MIMIMIMIIIQLVGPNDLFSILNVLTFLMGWLYLRSEYRSLILKHTIDKMIL